MADQTYLPDIQRQAEEQREATVAWHRASVEDDLAKLDPGDLALVAALVRLQASGVVLATGVVRPRAGVLVRAAEGRHAPGAGLQGAGEEEAGGPDVGISPGAPGDHRRNGGVR